MRFDRRWFVPCLLLAVSACGDDPQPTAPTPTPANVTSVAIDGPEQRDLGAPGQTMQLRAIATLSDGSRPDVTNDATWSTGNSRVLSVSPRGLVTGVADGGTSVTATYRERAGSTVLRVAGELGPRFLVTGVVRDAERGTPIVGAYIHPWRPGQYPIRAIDAGPAVRSDGNGFFELGTLAGAFVVYASQFGYADDSVTVPTLTAPAGLDIRLEPDTAPYIERTVSGTFDTYEADRDMWSSTLRIATRGAGVFDAVLRTRSCPPDGAAQIVALNAGYGRVSPTDDCAFARLRFVLQASDVQLTLQGFKVSGGWELTYREPR